MAYFLEERLPTCLRYDLVYDEDYAVEIVESGGSEEINASEYRRIVHPFPRRRFSAVAYQLDRDDLFNSVISLYHRAYGKFAGFRFKHMDDFTTAKDHRSPPSAGDQRILIVTPGVYQLRKRYSTDKTGLAIGWPERTIYKPVQGTVVVAVDGAVQSPANYTVDYTTGLITFAADPGATAIVTAGTEYDFPVRFNTPVSVKANHATSRYLEFELIELLSI